MTHPEMQAIVAPACRPGRSPSALIPTASCLVAAAFLTAVLAACGPRTAAPEAPPADRLPADSLTPAADTTGLPADTLPSPPDTTPSPAADTTAAAEASLGAARVCAGGDVLLGNNLDTLWAVRAAARLGRRVPPFPSPDSLLAPLRPLVGDADLVLINLEGAVGEGPAPSKCRPGSTRCYAFRQPPASAPALARWARPGAMVVNLANNHAMDAGADGFAATIRHLRGAGVHVTGADTLPTLVPILGGRDTVAILGFSPFRAGPDPRDLALVRRLVSRAAHHHPRVIVTMHMGAEGAGAQRTPHRVELFLGEDRGDVVTFARTAVQAGAALVVGHGPHVLRGAEWQDGALIFYSLGNLLTYGPFNFRSPRDRGLIACADIGPHGKVTEATLRPTRQVPPGLVAPDLSGRGTWLVDSLSRLDFPDSGARSRTDGRLRPGIHHR